MSNSQVRLYAAFCLDCGTEEILTGQRASEIRSRVGNEIDRGPSICASCIGGTIIPEKIEIRVIQEVASCA